MSVLNAPVLPIGAATDLQPPNDPARALDVLAMGEAMVEFNQTQPGQPQYLQGFGGDTSNAAIAAARQGARVGYVSAVGADTFGVALRELWRSEGVDDRAVRTDPRAPTGIYFVHHGPQGHQFEFRRAGSAASLMGPADVPPAVVAQARVLHVSAVSAAISSSACDAVYAAVAAARAAGTVVSLDTNLRLKLWPLPRARAVITDLLKQTDIALPSYDDITALAGLHQPEALVDWCLQQGARIVALKLGADGALVATANQRHWIEPLAVKAVDATGAGDTFGGAFLARWLAGDTPGAAGRYAAVAAALATTGWGAVAPIPTAQQVAQALAAGGSLQK
jgi:2-dehydro-3-deoxygluconokinase